jgi:ATP-dependent DNA helicase RecG
MLNGDGGIVVFGIKNSGKIVGQEIGDKTTRTIGEALRRFEPAVEIQPKYVKITDSDKKLIVFEAEGNNPDRPYSYDDLINDMIVSHQLCRTTDIRV